MTQHERPIALTFDDYLLRQAGRAFASGPALCDDVAGRLPRLLARMAECRSIRRAVHAERGLRIPAVLFLAITGACNLRCRYCYTSGYDDEHMRLSLAERTVTSCIAAGIERFLVVLGHYADQVRAHYQEIAARRRCQVEFVTADDWKLGNGASLLAASPL